MRIVMLVLGVVLFLAISGLLARFLTTENLEREDDLALLTAQASGNAKGMLALLSGCERRASCMATVEADASRLRRPGQVKILSLTSATAYTLTGGEGKTRIAWTVIGQLPVVQCVQVRREGSFISGISVKLLSVSRPIPKERSC
jgi:hypothetical protein